jgi:DNA-binding LacI/PurR family transcriptional regulator
MGVDRFSEKRITVAQVAKRLELSPTTVSLVLNGRAADYAIPGATITRVKRVAAQMNYRPSAAARQLKGKRSNAVGVLINTEAIADPRLIQRMEILAARRGLRFIVGHAVGTREQVKDYLDDFRARGVDCLISIFHGHPDYAETVLAELSRFDAVVYFEQPEDRAAAAKACYVQIDYESVGRAGVEHLIARGRLRIATVMNDMLFPYAKARFKAYRSALKAAGLKFKKERVWTLDEQSGTGWSSPFTDEWASEAIETVVGCGKADAIVAVNDTYAARLIRALKRSGRRVPDDVAVIGCDNQEIGTVVDPRVTTFELHIEQAAEAMVGLLFELLDHGRVVAKRRAMVIEPTLIVRESS